MTGGERGRLAECAEAREAVRPNERESAMIPREVRQ
jgi:hypothetical protein